MGWTSSNRFWDKHTAFKAALAGMKVHAKTIRGQVGWAVVESETMPDSEPYILCVLLRSEQGEWAYKDMAEACEPFYYSCPVTYLDMAPVKSEVWRAKVRDHSYRSQRKLKVGQVVTLDSWWEKGPLTLVQVHRRIIGKTANGDLYRLTKTDIAEVQG